MRSRIDFKTGLLNYKAPSCAGFLVVPKIFNGLIRTGGGAFSCPPPCCGSSSLQADTVCSEIRLKTFLFEKA